MASGTNEILLTNTLNEIKVYLQFACLCLQTWANKSKTILIAAYHKETHTFDPFDCKRQRTGDVVRTQ